MFEFEGAEERTFAPQFQYQNGRVLQWRWRIDGSRVGLETESTPPHRVRYIRNRGVSGVEHRFTVDELIAYQFPSETEGKEAAGQYEGTSWTVEVVEANERRL